MKYKPDGAPHGTRSTVLGRDRRDPAPGPSPPPSRLTSVPQHASTRDAVRQPGGMACVGCTGLYVGCGVNRVELRVGITITVVRTHGRPAVRRRVDARARVVYERNRVAIRGGTAL